MSKVLLASAFFLSFNLKWIMFDITPSSRLRPSPFFEATVADGASAFTTYNHMLMPTSYGHPEEEYWRLIHGVSMWDVAVERQVQLEGPDAGKLAQILSPRDLSRCKVGQGKYVAICNHDGILLNDPILLKLTEAKYWLSIADSNIWFWAKAIAAERGLHVTISEPDVSPLAIQGPKSEEMVASMLGDWVKDLKYFWFKETELDGIPLFVARSGWSKQGGFELYLCDGSQGNQLWQMVKEGGKAWDIGPGNPNPAERIESGLLSFGGDTDAQTNPFEVRMEKFVDLHVPDNVVGIQALRKFKESNQNRQQLGLILEGEAPIELGFYWNDILKNGGKVGDLTNCVWSWRMKKNIGFALVSSDCQPGDEVVVQREGKSMAGKLTELPFC